MKSDFGFGLVFIATEQQTSFNERVVIIGDLPNVQKITALAFFLSPHCFVESNSNDI